MEKVTPLTACTGPESVKKVVCRLLNSMSFDILAPLRCIQRVSQAVAEKIQRKNCEGDGETRENGHVRIVLNVASALRKHAAPFRRRRLHAQADKAQARRLQNGGAHAQCGLNDDGAQAVGQNVAEDQAEVGGAADFRRLHVFLLLHREHAGPDDAGVIRNPRKGHGENQIANPRAQYGGNGDGQDQRRNGEDNIHEAHEHIVHAAAEKARHGADDGAEDHGEDRCEKADKERNPRPVNHIGKNIPAEIIRAEEVLARGRLEAIGEILFVGHLGGDERRKNCYGDHDRDNEKAHDGHFIFLKQAKEVVESGLF